MWLVLCHPGDVSAIWAYRSLASLGVAPLRLISPEVLVCSVRSTHRIGAKEVSFSLQLADGTQLRSDELRGVLNRVVYLPEQHLRAAAPADRVYAREEWQALLLSWLEAIPGPVVNRAVPLGLAGAWRARSTWIHLAAVAGLGTARHVASSEGAGAKDLPSCTRSTSVLVLGSQIFSTMALAQEIRDACRRLASLAGLSLLGLELGEAPGDRWLFQQATAIPDMRPGGRPFLDELRRVLDMSPQGAP